MKRHLLYLLFFVLALGSCKKNKTELFMGDPDERLSAKLSEYQSFLTRAEFGWKAYLLTSMEQTGTLLFSFDEKNRVKMSADYNENTIESSYRLKVLQRPTLIFDTYSSLHWASDPTPSVFGGILGQGKGSDFEFAFISANTDTIKLEGTFYKSKLYLIRSKSAADNTTAFSAKNNFKNNVLSKLKTYFNRLTIDDIVYEINFDPLNSIFSFKYLDAGVAKYISGKCFVPDTTSLVFFDPITIGNKTLTGIKDVLFDASSNLIKATTNYGEPFQIKEANAPLYYDATAAARFIANPLRFSIYSKSFTGFTVDGVIDAYDVQKIDWFDGIFYIHKYEYYSYGAIKFRIAPPNVGAYAINYFPGILQAISDDGILSYRQAATFFAKPLPIDDIKTKIDKTTENFLIKGGFYVIQTSGRSYDLVAAKDARSWITFQ